MFRKYSNTSDDCYNSNIDPRLENILRFYTNQWKIFEISTKVKCEKEVYIFDFLLSVNNFILDNNENLETSDISTIA